MPIAAKDAEDRVDQLIILTDRLTSMILEETEMLKTRRPSELTAHEEEKGRLVNLYCHEMTRIRKDKALVAGAPKPKLDALTGYTAEFRKALAHHGSQVNRMMTVTEKMVQNIAKEIGKRTPSPVGYGADGQSPVAPRKGPALAVNQVV